jgi:hypothetical protein
MTFAICRCCLRPLAGAMLCVYCVATSTQQREELPALAPQIIQSSDMPHGDDEPAETRLQLRDAEPVASASDSTTPFVPSNDWAQGPIARRWYREIEVGCRAAINVQMRNQACA